MSDQPEFDLKVTGPEIEAAIKRGDYEWLVENVFTPALVQFLEKKNTDALLTQRDCGPVPNLSSSGTSRNSTKTC